MKNSGLASHIIIPQLNILPSKRCIARDNSQNISKIKSYGDKSEFQISTIQLDQTAKPMSYRQNNHCKQEQSKAHQFQSMNCTPKGHYKEEASFQPLIFGKPQMEQRLYSLDQPNNLVGLDLNSNILEGKPLQKTKDSKNKKPLQQQNGIINNNTNNHNNSNNNNMNVFRLRQTPSWFCQKINTQPKSDKIIEKKETFPKKTSEASTPKCRGNSNEKGSQNLQKLESCAKQMFFDNSSNIFSYQNTNNGGINKPNYQSNANNSKNNIFSSNCSTSRQNYLSLNQKKNELLKTKIAQNQQQECLQQKYIIDLRSKNSPNFTPENNQDIRKKKIEEQQQKLINKQQYFQQQSQQLQLQMQHLASMRQLIINEKIDQKPLMNIQSLLQATSLSPSSRFEAPASHMKPDDEESKTRNMMNLSSNLSSQQLQTSTPSIQSQIRSITSQTVNQALKRAKYFEMRSVSRDSLNKVLKPAKTLDQQQLASYIFEEEEPLQSSGQKQLISPIFKKYAKQDQNMLESSQQSSYDQIKIWQSSEQNKNETGSSENLKKLKPIISNHNREELEETKKDEFIKLYTKRYLNYPQISPTSKSMNDHEIKTLVLDVFYNQKRESSYTSIEEEVVKKQVPNNLSTAASGKTNQILSTPKNNKNNRKAALGFSDGNIAYEVAMMQINTPTVHSSAKTNTINSNNGQQSCDSTPLQKKLNSIFNSEDKNQITKHHNEFIKCFFQDSNKKHN